jgi:ribonuclease P protein component
MPRQYTLSKNERLKSRKRLDELFKEGQRFSILSFRVYYLPVANENEKNEPLQFGIGVSSKNFKKAVDRNRIKRLAREGWRVQKNNLKTLLEEQHQAAAVFLIYTGKDIPAFAPVKTTIHSIIVKLMNIVQKGGAAKTSNENL